MQIEIVLTGVRKNFTGVLNRHKFVNGRCTFTGGAELEFVTRYFARAYGGFPAGSPELAAAQKGDYDGVQHQPDKAPKQRDSKPVSGIQPEPPREISSSNSVLGSGDDAVMPAAGQEGLGAGGSGHEDAGLRPEQMTAIRTALDMLDPKVDEHWTESGEPSVEMVSSLLSDPSVSRKTIETVAPGFTRKTVAEAADL